MADKITELYAWIALDDQTGDDSEGIIGGTVGGIMLPLVYSRPHLAAPMRAVAVDIQRTKPGIKLELRKFTLVEVTDAL